MSQPEIGKEVRYHARHTGQIVIEPAESGAVMVYIPYGLVNAGFNFSGVHSVCVRQKDGNPSKAAIENIAKIFRLETPEDFFNIQEIEPNTDGTPEFELSDWYEHIYTNGQGVEVTEIRPRWINRIGGGFRKVALDAKGIKALSAKFGGPLKSILAQVEHDAEPESETESESEQEELPKRGGPPARKAGGPPARKSTAAVARTSTQDEVWEAYETANPCPKGKKADAWTEELGDKFWKKVEEVVPGKNGELSLEDWGAVAEALEQ